VRNTSLVKLNDNDYMQTLVQPKKTMLPWQQSVYR